MQLRDFDINLLNIFEAVWLTRSVSVAARRLNLGQSTISAALNRLRDQLSDELFIWNGHEMMPTPMAEQLMPLASDVLSRIRILLENAKGTPLSVERDLLISSADFIVSLYGAELISRADKEAPNIKLDFVTLGPAQVNKSSVTNIDLFIFPANAVRIAGLKKQACYMDEYVCIASENNKNIYEGIDAPKFLALPHIGYSAMPRMVFSHEALSWESMQVEPNYRMLMPGYTSFPDVVEESDVVAIVPKRFALKVCSSRRIKWINIPVKLPEIDFVMAWNPTHEEDPARKWLRNTTYEIMRNWTAPA